MADLRRKVQTWYGRLSHADTIISLAQTFRAVVTNPWILTVVVGVGLLCWSLLIGQFGPYIVVAALVAATAVLVARGAIEFKRNQERFGSQLEAIRDAAMGPPEIRTETQFVEPPDYEWLKRVCREHKNMGASAVFPKTRSLSASFPLTLWVRINRLEPDLVLVGNYFNRSIFGLAATNVWGKLVIPGIGPFKDDVLSVEGIAPPGEWFDIAIYVTLKTERARLAISEALEGKDVIKVDLQDLQVRMAIVDQPDVAQFQLKLADEWNPQVQVRLVPEAT